MLKKDQVLKALENGGCIMVDSIYRTARVLDENGDQVDTCRYDTAERIEHTDGYTKTYRGDWYATWYIEKEQPAQAAAQEEAEADAYWKAESERVRAAVAADLPGLVTEEEQPAPDYLDEHWPTSNEKENIYYSIEYLTTDGDGPYYFQAKSVDDLQDKVAQLQQKACYVRTGWRHDRTTGERREFIPESRQEKTDRENRERCRRIAEDLEAYCSGDAYKCPHCGEVHDMEDYEETEHENEDGCTCYTCPNCGEEIEEDDLEAVGVWDYFEDCLDIEYRCDARREYRSVRVMVTCGGPNIYIDTESKAVELYWWGDRASYFLLSDTVDAVDAWAAEYWECL